jgi:hypothetical protein
VVSIPAFSFHVPLEFNGGCSWQADDQLVEEAWRRGITILPSLNWSKAEVLSGSGKVIGVDRFLAPNDPNLATWGGWVQEVVERYGVNGTLWNGKMAPTPITAWEVWNEPNRAESNPLKSKAECEARGEHYYANAEIRTCIQPDAYGRFLKYTAERIQAASRVKTSHGTEVLFGGLYTRGEAEEENEEGKGEVVSGNSGSQAALSFLAEAALNGGLSSEVTGIALHP